MTGPDDPAPSAQPAFLVRKSCLGSVEWFSRESSEPLTIGRNAASGLRLDYPQVSRRHAEVILDRDGSFRIRDLASHNGTLVNGAPLQAAETTVAPPVEVQIGPCLLTFSIPEPEAPTVQAPIVPVRRTRLDRSMRVLRFDGQIVLERPSDLQFRLLDCLDAAGGAFVQSQQLGDSVWGQGQWDPPAVPNEVSRLRARIAASGVDPHAVIISKPGSGYRLG